MKQLLAPIRKKINELMRTLIISGIILTVLAVLIAWTDFVLRLMVGLIILVIAYSFFYGAYKLWTIKKIL
ncbi:MAG: hypothetical protein ABIG10_01000 [bacterium]